MRQIHNAKVQSKKRRAAKTRHRNKLQANRADKATKPVIVIGRSNQHTYAQLISFENHNSKVLAQASTLDKELKAEGTKTDKARAVGKLLAQRAKKLSITKVAFDRNGNRYHGRVKAVAEAAREEGMDF